MILSPRKRSLLGESDRAPAGAAKPLGLRHFFDENRIQNLGYVGLGFSSFLENADFLSRGRVKQAQAMKG